MDQWITRLNLLSQWCPELAACRPSRDADRHHLVEQLCHGAFGYKDIKDKPVKPVVKSWLSPAQQELLDKHAPERLTLSNGPVSESLLRILRATAHRAAHPGTLST